MFTFLVMGHLQWDEGSIIVLDITKVRKMRLPHYLFFYVCLMLYHASSTSHCIALFTYFLVAGSQEVVNHGS